MSSPETHVVDPSLQSSRSTANDSLSLTPETVNGFGFETVIAPPTENMFVVVFVTSTFQVTTPVAPSLRSKLAWLRPFAVFEIDHVLFWIQPGAAVFSTTSPATCLQVSVKSAESDASVSCPSMTRAVFANPLPSGHATWFVYVADVPWIVPWWSSTRMTFACTSVPVHVMGVGGVDPSNAVPAASPVAVFVSAFDASSPAYEQVSDPFAG